MTTPPTPTPFEAATMRTTSLTLRVCESLAVARMVEEARAMEAELSKLGEGTPPLENTVELGMMWWALTEFSVEGEH
jgi:hypothetical protein